MPTASKDDPLPLGWLWVRDEFEKRPNWPPSGCWLKGNAVTHRVEQFDQRFGDAASNASFAQQPGIGPRTRIASKLLSLQPVPQAVVFCSRDDFLASSLSIRVGPQPRLSAP